MAGVGQIKRTGAAESGTGGTRKRKPSGAQKDAIVTVRMTEEKKESAARVLDKLGVTPSAAINMFYDYLVEHGTLPFDAGSTPKLSAQQWQEAANFIDSILPAVSGKGATKR